MGKGRKRRGEGAARSQHGARFHPGSSLPSPPCPPTNPGGLQGLPRGWGAPRGPSSPDAGSRKSSGFASRGQLLGCGRPPGPLLAQWGGSGLPGGGALGGYRGSLALGSHAERAGTSPGSFLPRGGRWKEVSPSPPLQPRAQIRLPPPRRTQGWEGREGGSRIPAWKLFGGHPSTKKK